MPSFALIIPCYNEADRLETGVYIAFANRHQDIPIVFVNDGSTDGTLEILKTIKAATTNTHLVSYEKNRGKGAAVQEGFRYVLKQQINYVGYIDADLSTSLDEFYELMAFAISKKLDFVLASRIKKLDSVIERNYLRHLIGRTIATLVDFKFNFGIYDTQCGAKVFRTEVLQDAVKENFWTRWFFDVELLIRIRGKSGILNGAEVPLRKWVNKRQSKISLSSYPEIIKDLAYLLFFKY